MFLKNRQLEVLINDEQYIGYHIDVDYSFETNNTSPNQCNIKIYNFAGKILEGGKVIVRAGYEGNIYQVFEGEITDSELSIQKNSNILTLTVLGAVSSFRRIIEPTKITKGTSIKEFIKQIAQKSKLKIGTMDIPNININRDYSISDYPMVLIDNLAHSYGFYYILDNSNTLHCYQTSVNTATILSSESGLLNYKIKWSISEARKKVIVPDKKNPPKKTRKNTNDKPKITKEGTRFSAECLFIPTLSLNHKVILEDPTRGINLEGMINKMSVRLSNYGNDWYSSLDDIQVL
jgi:hypothetical protein